MEKYDNLGLVGEGSYGVVMKCRHKETKQMVAIKKFLESEDDRTVRKIALREIKLLKMLRHDNLVNLLEVFRRKKRLYLVFEYVDRTVLDDLERHPRGLDETYAKKILYQVVRAIEFCHQNNIIHRDVKPENILVTKSAIVKVCDFGFARATAGPGDSLTDYVATRWYRAPELIVGDPNYGKPVDVWAIGCLFSEMLSGDPLFPGDSDIDQLFHIIKCFGNLPARYEEIFRHNPIFRGVNFPEVKSFDPFDRRYPRFSKNSRDFIKISLALDANDRPSCQRLIEHDLFQRENFAQRFTTELNQKISREAELNRPLNLTRKSQDNGSKTSKNHHQLGAAASKPEPKQPPPPQQHNQQQEEATNHHTPVPPPQPSVQPSPPMLEPHPEPRGASVAVEEKKMPTPRTPQPPTDGGQRHSPTTTPPLTGYEVIKRYIGEPEDRHQACSKAAPDSDAFASKEKSKRSVEAASMPPIPHSTNGAERASPVHVTTVTPTFASSPTPQPFNTGPPPLKLSVKRSSFALGSTSPKPLTPAATSPSASLNCPPRFLPLIRPSEAPGLLPSLPLNKQPGHAASGKPKKGVHPLLPYPAALSHVTHLKSLTQTTGRQISSEDESREEEAGRVAMSWEMSRRP